MRFLSVLLLCAVLINYLSSVQAQQAQQYVYGVTVDAGSSGSRIYIYQWLQRVDGSVPHLSTAPLNQTQWSKKVTPGLGTFASKLSQIAAYLQPLIDYAVANIPAANQNSTIFFLKATGGLRALSQSDQDAIMAQTRVVLHTSPFTFNDSFAQVIPLETEATFGWVAANYLQGLVSSANATVGGLDMGGASTEIAFSPLTTPLSSATSITLGTGYAYNVFASGFNARGNDDALLVTNLYQTRGLNSSAQNVVYNPCYLVGWSETTTDGFTMMGTGDFNACKALVRTALLNTSVPCPIAPCSFEGHYQPTIPPNMLFYAYSAYWYTFQGVFNAAAGNLTSVGAFQDGAQVFCGRNYTLTRSLYNTVTFPDSFLSKYCWSGVYFTELLLTYGFARDARNLMVSASIQNIEITWALGSMLYDAALTGYVSPVLPTATAAPPTAAPPTAVPPTAAAPTASRPLPTVAPTAAQSSSATALNPHYVFVFVGCLVGCLMAYC